MIVVVIAVLIYIVDVNKGVFVVVKVGSVLVIVMMGGFFMLMVCVLEVIVDLVLHVLVIFGVIVFVGVIGWLMCLLFCLCMRSRLWL